MSDEIVHSILLNAGLLVLFVAQHSLMTHGLVKTFLEVLGMPALVRPFYVCCTCIVINVSEGVWLVAYIHARSTISKVMC